MLLVFVSKKFSFFAASSSWLRNGCVRVALRRNSLVGEF